MSVSRNIYRKRGTGTITSDGYLLIGKARDQRPEHVLIAERARGNPLPKGAVVHHVNENGLDNRHENLVVCPNQAYHLLLHQRTRAYDACGHASWRKCPLCKQYSDPALMESNGKSFLHTECRRAYAKKRFFLRTRRALP